MPRPRIVFVDGLPGSGKSTAAQDIGRRCLDNRIFLESHPSHPLLVGVPDEKGAAFAHIHEVHSVASFGAAALERMSAFLGSADVGVPFVFESHPFQSTVRVLMQLDAPEPVLMKFWSELQDRLKSADVRLLYFRENDPRQAFMDIMRVRGTAWENYVIDAFNHYPWTKARGLSGIEGALKVIDQYSMLIERLLASWRFNVLTLPARPARYPERTEAFIRWLATPAPEL
jgi:hypothetical protein